MKEVKTRKFSTFELETLEGMKVPIWIFVGFQQRYGQDSQNSNIYTFYKPPVTNAQCNIGTEKCPHTAVLLNYGDDGYSQGYGQNKQAFEAIAKNDILNPFISDHDCRSTNVNAAGDTTNDIG